MQETHRIDSARSAGPKRLKTAVPWYRAPALPTLFPTSVDVLCRFARILAEEGYPAIEILARPLDLALQVFEQVCRRPERTMVTWMIGTITSESKAREALALSPDALVSPAFSPKVLRVACEAGVPYVPAVQTFQDVQNVLDAFEEEGLEVEALKLCPVYGLTPEYVIAMGKCFPGIVFCPSGEIDIENYSFWKELSPIGAPMGAELVPSHLLEEQDFDGVRRSLRLLRRLSEDAVKSAPTTEREASSIVGETKSHPVDRESLLGNRKPLTRKAST